MVQGRNNRANPEDQSEFVAGQSGGQGAFAEMSENLVQSAKDELEAIVKAAEEAANKVMDAADEIQEIVARSGEDVVQQMADVATRIYEASGFQDITGQRVSRVVETLASLEERIGLLATGAGNFEPKNPSLGKGADPEGLLHGPQLPGNANEQDDIDAILASFDRSA